VYAYFPSVSYDNLENYYLWVIIYFLIINIVNTRKRFFIFLCVFLVASFKISLSLAITWAKRGFSFTDWGLSGPAGFFQNSGELAIQMLVFWPIAWAFAHSLKPYVSKKWYWLLMLMPITAIMVILGASSRGAQLALLVQLVVMNYRTVFKPKVFITCGIAFFLLWTFLPDEQKERFQTMGEDGTSRQRILYWENGIEMIKEHPGLGVGYFNFPAYFEIYYPDDVLLRQAELPHNIFIQIGTDTGFSGLSMFFGFLLIAYRHGRRFRIDGCEGQQALIGRCANLSLLGFVVAGQFVTVAYYPFLWIHLALVVALTNSFQSGKTHL
jgi:O-antigen ligase